MNVVPAVPARYYLLLVSLLACHQTHAQNLPLPSDLSPILSTSLLPDAPSLEPQLQTRPAGPVTPAAAPLAANGKPLAIVNGVPYRRPTQHETFIDYAKDTYGLPAFFSTTIRAVYSQYQGTPVSWSQDAQGFGYRFGSSTGITIISGNVRYGMEELFHEDLRYIACHGCGVKKKIANALLAEITARHDDDGHRFFTLTPTVADFSGPIIAHTIWYPGAHEGPFAGVVSARTYFATRVGAHLFREFVLEHYARHEHPEPPPPAKTP